MHTIVRLTWAHQTHLHLLILLTTQGFHCNPTPSHYSPSTHHAPSKHIPNQPSCLPNGRSSSRTTLTQPSQTTLLEWQLTVHASDTEAPCTKFAVPITPQHCESQEKY